MIKNIDLITDKTEKFSLQNIRYIVGFFLSFQNELPEKTSLLDIDFIYEDDKKQYIVRLRFYNPESINFESGGPYHQININIHDIRDRGWEVKNYEVFDYEEDTLSFYCAKIEAISVKETIYII
ncbi:hypothetical protein [Peribacillus loiseleuriae]|uniref:hypothetical protein n=1 Tax=Peribacillus loiseleuriae TaxID=1679170 RepID=UPI003CFF550C